jgi:hypothetical protein
VKRTAFYLFRYKGPTGKWRTSRHRVKLEDLPAGAEILPETVEWRDLPESRDEHQYTSGWQEPKA